VSLRSAWKWQRGPLPSETTQRRTRVDPLDGVAEEINKLLVDGVWSATEISGRLGVDEKHLRTLQRRVAQLRRELAATPSRAKSARTYAVIAAEAVAAEKARKWSEARALWNEAASRAQERSMPPTAGRPRSKRAENETRSALRYGWRIGERLVHVTRKGAEATCTWRGEGDWRFRGKRYRSIHQAADATAKALDLRDVNQNGWVFWGAERRDFEYERSSK
jgi:hypothetical protein